jgi:hypothetical protein
VNLSQTPLAEIILASYQDPDPCVSLEEFSRARHDDLPGLTLEEIDRERILARLRWAVDPEPSRWFLDRMRRLETEADRRRRGRG